VCPDAHAALLALESATGVPPGARSCSGTRSEERSRSPRVAKPAIAGSSSCRRFTSSTTLVADLLLPVPWKLVPDWDSLRRSRLDPESEALHTTTADDYPAAPAPPPCTRHRPEELLRVA